MIAAAFVADVVVVVVVVVVASVVAVVVLSSTVDDDATSCANIPRAAATEAAVVAKGWLGVGCTQSGVMEAGAPVKPASGSGTKVAAESLASATETGVGDIEDDPSAPSSVPAAVAPSVAGAGASVGAPAGGNTSRRTRRSPIAIE